MESIKFLNNSSMSIERNHMRKKTFIRHFILLSISLLAFSYIGAMIIEHKEQNNLNQMILSQSDQLSERAIDILSNNQLDDKNLALKFIFQSQFTKEPSLAIYQISTMKNNVFYPILMGKREDAPGLLISVNDLITTVGQMKSKLIKKGSYIIYHKDMIDGRKYYGKLFIAYLKNTYNIRKSQIYLYSISFSIFMILSGLILFYFFSRRQNISDESTDVPLMDQSQV